MTTNKPTPAGEQPTVSVEVAYRGADEKIRCQGYPTDVPGLAVVHIYSNRVGWSYHLLQMLTGTQIGGAWSTLDVARAAARAVNDALHIDWEQYVDPSLGNAVTMQFNQVHEDLNDWPHGRPPKLRLPLYHPGDNHAADAAVICVIAGVPHILLGEREDGDGWALPGGGVDDGETTEAAARRELLEETGLDATGVEAWHLERNLPVDDPRNTHDRRMVTDLFLFLLDPADEPPAVTAGDDLVRVTWAPVTSLNSVMQHVVGMGGFLFRPHPPLLQAALAELRTMTAIGAYFDDHIRKDWIGVDPDVVTSQRKKYLRDVRTNPAALREALAGHGQQT